MPVVEGAVPGVIIRVLGSALRRGSNLTQVETAYPQYVACIRVEQRRYHE